MSQAQAFDITTSPEMIENIRKLGRVAFQSYAAQHNPSSDAWRDKGADDLFIAGFVFGMGMITEGAINIMLGKSESGESCHHNNSTGDCS